MAKKKHISKAALNRFKIDSRREMLYRQGQMNFMMSEPSTLMPKSTSIKTLKKQIKKIIDDLGFSDKISIYGLDEPQVSKKISKVDVILTDVEMPVLEPGTINLKKQEASELAHKISLIKIMKEKNGLEILQQECQPEDEDYVKNFKDAERTVLNEELNRLRSLLYLPSLHS